MLFSWVSTYQRTMTAKSRTAKSSTTKFSAGKSSKAKASPQCKECAGCYEILPMSSFPTGRITKSCTHGTNMCRSCVSKFIKIQQETRMWNHISCPSCPFETEASRLDYNAMRRFADAATFKRWDSIRGCIKKDWRQLATNIWRSVIQYQHILISCGAWVVIRDRDTTVAMARWSFALPASPGLVSNTKFPGTRVSLVDNTTGMMR
jgi:hypothetical protein